MNDRDPWETTWWDVLAAVGALAFLVVCLGLSILLVWLALQGLVRL